MGIGTVVLWIIIGVVSYAVGRDHGYGRGYNDGYVEFLQKVKDKKINDEAV